jgi:hypothetical protein
MSGDVTRFYDRLEPHERMIAAIAAAVRSDDQEIDRLVRSCPRHKYVQPDLAYTRYMGAAEFVTTALVVKLGPLLATLSVFDSVCDYLELRSGRYLEAVWLATDAAFRQGVQWGWARSGREDDPPDPNDADDELVSSFDPAYTRKITAVSLGVLRKIAADLATLSRGVWDGFTEWASEENLEPLALVTVFRDDFKPQLEAARQMLDAAESDREVAVQYADLCRAVWASYR